MKKLFALLMAVAMTSCLILANPIMADSTVYHTIVMMGNAITPYYVLSNGHVVYCAEPDVLHPEDGTEYHECSFEVADEIAPVFVNVYNGDYDTSTENAMLHMVVQQVIWSKVSGDRDYRANTALWLGTDAVALFDELAAETDISGYEVTFTSYLTDEVSANGMFYQIMIEASVQTAVPTPEPTEAPTPVPTEIPTPEPTEVPTLEPTPVPTATPTATPTEVPNPVPTEMPTPESTTTPTLEPTATPTPETTAMPTETPLVLGENDPIPRSGSRRLWPYGLLAAFVGVAVLIYRRKRIDKTNNFD